MFSFTADYNHLDVLDVEPPNVSDQSVDIFAKLCKKLRFVYKPEMFSNPSLQVSALRTLSPIKFFQIFSLLVFTSEIL